MFLALRHGDVPGYATCFGIGLLPSSDGKWLKHSGWHNHGEYQNQRQATYFGATHSWAFRVWLAGAFQLYLEGGK